MQHPTRSTTVSVAALLALLIGACSSSMPKATGAGGSPGTGGATIGTGGAATGGTSAGGSPGTGGGTGGQVIATGGVAGTAGAGTGGGRAGAGGGGAGTSGTGGTGGAVAGGCAGKTYKLCEDFESSTAGSVPTGWTSFKGYNGKIGATDQAVATDAAHSGSKALKSIAAAQGSARVQKALSTLGATASKHWGRIFYKVQSPSAVDPKNVLHTTFVSLLGGSAENRIVDTVETQNAHTHQWLFNTPDDGCCTSSSYNWTFDDAWHCAEWYVDLTTKSYRFFSDSTEVTQIAFSNR
ncbi:MAG TPA: hypothetical protein VLT58_14550, partial [Polyangia bacterium]|nr:hypothetical protein [Polyangia bacterium]